MEQVKLQTKLEDRGLDQDLDKTCTSQGSNIHISSSIFVNFTAEAHGLKQRISKFP